MPQQKGTFIDGTFYFQRLAKRKQKKQVELDKCAFDPEHMAEESHHGNGGSFPMVEYPVEWNIFIELPICHIPYGEVRVDHSRKLNPRIEIENTFLRQQKSEKLWNNPVWFAEITNPVNQRVLFLRVGLGLFLLISRFSIFSHCAISEADDEGESGAPRGDEELATKFCQH